MTRSIPLEYRLNRTTMDVRNDESLIFYVDSG